jgi:hypothetical protein
VRTEVVHVSKRQFDSARHGRDWALWRRWTVATTHDEAAGFCAPAVAGGLAATASRPTGATAAATTGLAAMRLPRIVRRSSLREDAGVAELADHPRE